MGRTVNPFAASSPLIPRESRTTGRMNMREPVVRGEWADGCRRGFRGKRRFRSIATIVQDYTRRFRPRAARELQFFASLRSMDEVITQAGFARMPNGKRWVHQRRIPDAALERATGRLRLSRLEEARSFDDLIDRVNSAVRSIRGIGELYVYDTALRIGAHLGLMPREVYLHAGARMGAQALHLNSRSGSVPLDRLPVDLRRLEPHEIEDVLCIYKDWLMAARNA